MHIVKCISAGIYKHYGDCSNNGISHRFTEVLIPCADGYIEVDKDNPPENFCELEVRSMFGRECIRAVPFIPYKAGKWLMMGGTFIYCSDSRFPFEYPIPLHDRMEG